MSCNLSKERKWYKQTWCWDSSVNDAVKDKRRLWQIWKNGGREEDILAKKLAWQRVFATKKKAGKEKMKDIETDTYIILSYRVGIKVSRFLNHKSSSWSCKPKIWKTSTFHKLFYLKYNVFKIIHLDNICLPISLELDEWDWTMKEQNFIEWFELI